ncbi:hypothetical protein QTN47_27430 [Danxiaibacter flavus]|uniref:Uncharacterized protein n=1 Tax=Danxiaibacter flavus TaxID=3049108 RepID=A0ABV3ZN09_9BACT|nr:hypothetical protein QNM32_27430 [Chitinophagaceae bacterium DXS]
MKATFEPIEDLCSDYLATYSVYLDDNPITEYEQFYEKEFPNHAEEIKEIDYILYQCTYRGALSNFFYKHEGAASAIPYVKAEIIEKNTIDFGIRLYCIRLRNDMLILLNGDVKTHIDPAQCPKVSRHFALAHRLGRAIDKALGSRDLIFNHRECLQGEEINI